MDSLNRHAFAASPRPSERRWRVLAAALLLATLLSAQTATGARAADPISEVAGAAGATVEAAGASAPTVEAAGAAPSPTAPPPSPAPAPESSPAPQPVPSAPPAAVAGVGHSLGSGAGAAVPRGIADASRHGTGVVEAVVETSAATHVPIVDDAARAADDAVRSATGAASEITSTTAAHSSGSTPAGAHRPGPTGADGHAVGAEVLAADADRLGTGGHVAAPGPAGREVQIGPPAPRSEPDPLPLSSRPDIYPTGSGSAFDALVSVIVPPAMESPATTEGGSRAEQIDSVGPHPPFPSPDLGAVASSSAGGSFAPSLLLLGIVTLFLLAAPRVPPRLLADAGGHWPAAFACALERPG